jgi:hypothetical protein
MHNVTFFPLGNADTCRIDLHDGRKLLFDFANIHDPDDKDDLRIDLAKELLDDLGEAQQDYFDVVAITHADDDHIHRFSEFFYLEHAEKYQEEGRIQIHELWVPAAVIIEEGLTGEARILRSEARHRLKQKKGVRVFSRLRRLQAWLEKEGLELDDFRHLITDAGQLVSGFDKSVDGVEFFAHSPFAKREDDELIYRNESSLVLQATFGYAGVDTQLILSADTTYDVWQEIVNITRYKERDYRLSWDIFKLPHHCSYTALSSEKGKDKTKPVDEVKWLFEQGKSGGIIVSTSNPIPNNDDSDQPPHRQAANFYKDIVSDIDGTFIVTMEHPSKSKPEPLVINIDTGGPNIENINKHELYAAVAPVIINRRPARPWSKL